MTEDRVKLQSIVENQLPEFVREDFPLIGEFLKQYYISQEFQGGSFDLIQNIDKYLKLEENSSTKEFTYLSQDVSLNDTTINAGALGVGQLISTFTQGFPERWGLLLIDNEIITYEYKTQFTFEGCKRGFSGVTSLKSPTTPDELVFKSSSAAKHKKEAKIYNLSVLFLSEFFTKIKKQFIPGFSERTLDSDLNSKTFISRAKDFYDSKGTDKSFKILFGALYGEDVEVVKPKDYLFKPSDAGYRVTQDIVVESIQGNPLELLNQTIFQDEYSQYNIESSRASVTNVEKITYDENVFYKLSLDFDYDKDIDVQGTIFGNFVVHPKTKILNNVSVGATIIDVDSTVGFPDSGEVVVVNVDGRQTVLSFNGKSLTQFFNVSSVSTAVLKETDLRLNSFAYGYNENQNQIKFRIGSVLQNLKVLEDNTYRYSAGDTVKIKSLGKSDISLISSTLINNVKGYWEVRNVNLIDSVDRVYNITTYDNHNLRVGNNVVLKDSASVETSGTVTDVISSKVFTVRVTRLLNANLFFTVENQVLKGNSTRYPYLTKIQANIQNSYVDFGRETLIASNSLPNYYNESLNPFDKKFILNGTYSGEIFRLTTNTDHGLYTGDAIFYEPLKTVSATTDIDGNPSQGEVTSKFSNLSEGVYYVSRVDSNRIKIAKSKSDIFNSTFISVSDTVTNNKFIYYNFYKKNLEPQQILRKISPPVNQSDVYTTEPGYNGMFVNGTELLNYKSSDTVFYGTIESVIVSSPGSDYDVINPPVLNIRDSVGTAATGICAVNGTLKRIEILDTGFDYLETPVVKISGGGGVGASAEVNTSQIEHNVFFNSESASAFVNLTNNTIGFSTYHKFRDNERIIYKTDGSSGVSGLTTGSSYYAFVVDSKTIKLHTKESDAISGINTVNLTSYGSGVHRFKSSERKQVVTDIIVTDPGSGYKNKERRTSTTGISTSNNQINIKDHGYSSGEIIEYSTTGTSIKGLDATKQYYVNKVDDNNFTLSLVGTGVTAKDFYFKNSVTANLKSKGSGTHTFNYPPIVVTVDGITGVSTRTDQSFDCRIQPIFRGSIDSIHLTNNGVGYGSSEILNFDRQPEFEFITGSQAEFTPIVSDGRITEILVSNQGKNYNTPPEIEIIGTGKYAKLTPVIRDGKIIEIKIINGGVGYGDNTFINLKSSGLGCVCKANIKRWTVNLFEKYFNILTRDDGIVETSIARDSLQYSHLFAPRSLRSSLYAKNPENAIFLGEGSTLTSVRGDLFPQTDVLTAQREDLYGLVDLPILNGQETSPSYHSPILGWAYDGNPIYGPYGYTTQSGGIIRQMISGYELVSKSNRPSSSAFPQGFFVEDYEYTGNGDLDEHNGRFCITPEYPNGTYAYFASINSGSVDSGGPFKDFKRPQFPYVIGNSFKSKPIDFNYKTSSNQTDYDFSSTNWFRNTKPYNINNQRSGYNYIFNPDKVKEQLIDITGASTGGVESLGITTGGKNYRTNDRIVFDNTNTGGVGASAKVSKIKGKKVNTVSCTTTVFDNIEFTPYSARNQYVGFSSTPHNLDNGEIVSIVGLSSYIKNFENRTYRVGINSEVLSLVLGVGTTGSTGMTTYFYVSGLLDFPAIRENDILGISTERVKVLNVDQKSNRIRVLREYDGTVGTSYSSTQKIYEDPRKFTVNVGYRTSGIFRINNEYYFDPSESVGVGTVSGIGLGTTVTFSNPGIGLTQIFIPVQAIYHPNHNLKINDVLTYSANGGTSLGVSTNGISSYSLSDITTLYAAPISKDFIGISSSKVGIAETGVYNNILFFHNYGSGNYHSLKTSLSDVISGQVIKNEVTVSTSSTHGLSKNDIVDFNLTSSTQRTVTVKYDSYNRRIVFDPKSFTSLDVNVESNSISISDHNFITGDRVIHTATSPTGGLEDEAMYYVFVVTSDKIKLLKEKYTINSSNPSFVKLTSASSGTLSRINPYIGVIRNRLLKFDLSDPSLAFTYASNVYSAFEFNFYGDKEFKNEFYTSSSSDDFEVTRSGRVGIDSTAYVQIQITSNIPNTLYYNFTLDNTQFIFPPYSELILDNTVTGHNQIDLVNSAYVGKHSVSGIGSTTFQFTILDTPELSVYTQSNSVSSYETTSSSALGEISKVDIVNSGAGYKDVPGISTVITELGYGAIFEPNTTSIGNIVKTKIQDIGFDYPSDVTLRPVANLPEILSIEPLSSFVRIGISSGGRNYTVAPGIIVKDGFTDEIVDDLDLKYNLGDTEVTILKNTFGLYSAPPVFIPVQNSNGVGISSVTFNNTSKDVVVYLDTQFSDPENFPFSVGDKVLVENVSVGLGSLGKGYNSRNYNYNLFELTGVSTSLGGGNANVTYNLQGYLTGSEYPGTYNAANSYGRIIPEKQFPIFSPTLAKNNFLRGETVYAGEIFGTVESWNNKTEYVTVSSDKDFLVGDIITGQSSNTKGVVKSKIEFNGEVETGFGSIVESGWSQNTGFLNDNLQRISDNFYYQYFSYSLKSKVPYQTWDDAVSSLNHTTGFRKFSDLIIETTDDSGKNIVFADDSDTEVITDIVGSGNLNCYYDFDLASEGTVTLDYGVISNEIIFKTRVLTDYFESVGNRVLIIDDISNLFNSSPRPTRYGVIDTFLLANARTKKYITFVRDKRFTAERQTLIVSLLHDDVNGYLNQYGRIETYTDLGSFDFSIAGEEGQLLFYPIKYTVNDYDISHVSFDLKDNITSVGSTNIGDIVNIKTTHTNVSAATTTTIVGIASTYRSSKVLVEIKGENNVYEYDELNIIHNGTEVELLEYGQLTSHSLDSFSSSGLGTYWAYLSGSNLNLDFAPTPGIALTANTITVSIANTATSGVGSISLNNSRLQSSYTSIAATSSPIQNTVCEYDGNMSSAYYLVSAEDITNGETQFSEVIVADDGTTASIVEYANLETSSGIGTIDAAVTATGTQLYFTPNAGIDVEVRVFQLSLELFDGNTRPNQVNFNNGKIITNSGDYEGTEKSVRREFNLTHNGDQIFQRNFDGSNVSIANTSTNTITIADHFFVTGEEVVYTHSGAGSTQAIGIASTSFVGVGTTDKLPSSVFIVKVNDSKVKLARSAEDALSAVPNTLDLITVGIGTSHTFTSKNQNAKCIILIDNMFQSPIVSSAVTTTLVNDILTTDNRLTFSGITSFFGGDLIQVDNEIMKINTVGLGSTNVILVDRPWMGTGISSHSANSEITKVTGNYNIVDNTLHFVEAPYGKIPLSSTTNPPDSRDWVGITTSSSFQGRTFLRSGVANGTQETYSKNYVFDDISNRFTGIAKTFTLTSDKQNTTGFSTENAIILINNIFQGPQGSQASVEDYTLNESVGITSITFLGTATSVSYDVNSSTIPVGGVIVSVASTGGFGYQPLVAAGGTAVVSASGTIQSISIGNSGSGYRAGIQTVVNVGVQTLSTGTPAIEFIGTAAISGGNIVSIAITNPGVGYTSSNPPIVVIDEPLSYSDIPLVYSSSSSGGGNAATIDIVVGQGSSVVDFSIKNFGYGYGQSEILTVNAGGLSGIPTDTSLPFEEFQITIDRTFTDKFAGWSIGELEVLDKLDDLFDGSRKTFPLSLNGNVITIRSAVGSNIDVRATLLIFINDVLQSGGGSYEFEGGSILTFNEAPKAGDKSKILFYKGSGDVDVVFKDILETVKVGDDLTLNYDPEQGQGIILQQDPRIVTGINTSDSVATNPYPGPGVTTDTDVLRPVTWCKQTSDKIINGKEIGKNRIQYEPLINPISYMIQPVGLGSTEIFVDSLKTGFDPLNESNIRDFQNQIVVTSQDVIVGASATALVSIAGTISSISISDGGRGYVSAPQVTISNPVGLGSTQRASATASITSGIITSISVDSPGTGYTTSNPPQVLIESPSLISETINVSSYEGDFGEIVGVSTTSVGVASTGIVFDFYIPENSYLRDSSITGVTTISGIQTGYYFVVKKSNIGNGVTSLYNGGSVLGVGTQSLDSVYQVAAVSIAQTSVPGIALTYVARVTTSVSDYNSLSGTGSSEFFGEFSWGRILLETRTNPKEFNSYTLSGIGTNDVTGISTSAIVGRLAPLKYSDYTS